MTTGELLGTGPRRLVRRQRFVELGLASGACSDTVLGRPVDELTKALDRSVRTDAVAATWAALIGIACQRPTNASARKPRVRNPMLTCCHGWLNGMALDCESFSPRERPILTATRRVLVKEMVRSQFAGRSLPWST